MRSPQRRQNRIDKSVRKQSRNYPWIRKPLPASHVLRQGTRPVGPAVARFFAALRGSSWAVATGCWLALLLARILPVAGWRSQRPPSAGPRPRQGNAERQATARRTRRLPSPQGSHFLRYDRWRRALRPGLHPRGTRCDRGKASSADSHAASGELLRRNSCPRSYNNNTTLEREVGEGNNEINFDLKSQQTKS